MDKQIMKKSFSQCLTQQNIQCNEKWTSEMSTTAHTDLPLLFRTRKTMSTMRSTMIMISSKQPITIPATSPAFRHVSEIERMVSKGEN